MTKTLNYILSSRGLAIAFALVAGLSLFIMFLYFGIAWTARATPRQAFFQLCFQWFPVSQLLLVAPVVYSLHRTRRKAAVQGWLIGAGLAAILTAPCWGLPLILKWSR